MSTINLQRVAKHLYTTMCNAGVFDDYDEIIGDAFSQGSQVALDYHLNVLESIEFINKNHPEFLGKQLRPQKWQAIYDRICS